MGTSKTVGMLLREVRARDSVTGPREWDLLEARLKAFSALDAPLEPPKRDLETLLGDMEICAGNFGVDLACLTMRALVRELRVLLAEKAPT